MLELLDDASIYERLEPVSYTHLYYIESHEDLSQVLQIELEGLSSVCGQNLTVQLKPQAALEKSTVLNQYRTEAKGRELVVTVGDVYAVEDKVLALDLQVKPSAVGPCPLATIAFSYRVLEGGVTREVTDQIVVTVTAASKEAAAAAAPDLTVLGEALRQRAAKAKDAAVELADKGQHKEAATQLQQVAESIRNSPVANQFEFTEEIELLEHFAERPVSYTHLDVYKRQTPPDPTAMDRAPKSTQTDRVRRPAAGRDHRSPPTSRDARGAASQSRQASLHR